MEENELKKEVIRYFVGNSRTPSFESFHLLFVCLRFTSLVISFFVLAILSACNPQVGLSDYESGKLRKLVAKLSLSSTDQVRASTEVFTAC